MTNANNTYISAANAQEHAVRLENGSGQNFWNLELRRLWE